jgi:hypothetical protein
MIELLDDSADQSAREPMFQIVGQQKPLRPKRMALRFALDPLNSRIASEDQYHPLRAPFCRQDDRFAKLVVARMGNVGPGTGNSPWATPSNLPTS